MRKIVITPRGFAACGEDCIERMERCGFSVDYNDTGKAYTAAQFYEHCRDAEGLIVGVERVDREFIDSCPKLRAVVKFGVGTDNIDLAYCRDKGIYTGRCAGCNSRSVAELALAFALAETKNLYNSLHDTRSGAWNKYMGYEVLGKTFGIVGFGAVGKALAQMANGLGMHVLAYDAFEIGQECAEQFNVTISDLDTIYRTSDFISLHVPLTKETENMITLEEMKKMKRGCVLINTARGGIVSEKDLYRALAEKIIRAAYFDVFTSEPPERDEPLLTLENFYLSPHIASRAVEAEKNTCRISTDVILAALGGRQETGPGNGA